MTSADYTNVVFSRFTPQNVPYTDLYIYFPLYSMSSL